MSDPHAEILTGGPGEPADRWEPGEPADRWEPGESGDRRAAGESGDRWEPAKDADRPQPGAPAKRRQPGALADRWQPGGSADRLEAGGSAEEWEPAEDGEEPGVARSAAWRGVLRGVLGPESLALAGLVLAILPWLGMTVLGRLGAAVAIKGDGMGDLYPESGDDLATATGGFSAAVALLAVFLGVVALRRADLGRRATVAMAGAAVIVGVLGAALHLLTLAAGPAGAVFW